MRIIGGRDYYDSAGYGFDESTTFVRKPVFTPLDSTPLHYASREFNGKYVYRFDVVVAGNLYPAVCLSMPGYTGEKHRFIYDQAEADEEAKNLPHYSYKQYLDLSVSDARRKLVREWALDNKIVTALSGAEERDVTEYNRRGYALFSNWNRKYVAVCNSDALKDIELFRILSPAEAHQSIASWVGGVLPFNTPTLEISDRSRIQKAGFDLRTSFRKVKA